MHKKLGFKDREFKRPSGEFIYFTYAQEVLGIDEEAANRITNPDWNHHVKDVKGLIALLKFLLETNGEAPDPLHDGDVLRVLELSK